MENNPYTSPAANLFGDTGSTLTTGREAVAESTVQLLRQTKPWARFVGVLLMILAVVIFSVIVGTLGTMLSSSQGASAAYRLGFMSMAGLFYGFMAFCYFYPGLKLNRFASRIGALMMQPTVEGLDAALDQQRRMWKFVGIVGIILLSIMVLAIAAGVASQVVKF